MSQSELTELTTEPGATETLDVVTAQLDALEARLPAALETPERRAVVASLVLSISDSLERLRYAPANGDSADVSARIEAEQTRLDAIRTSLVENSAPEEALVASIATGPAELALAKPIDWMAVGGQVLMLVGVGLLAFVLFVFGLTWLSERRSQHNLMQKFKAEAAVGKLPVGGQIPEGSPVALLDIPRLGVHQVVVEGTDAVRTEAGPGHLRSSPLPGQRGNAVIAGRRTTYGAPFLHLDELRPGNTVTVTTGEGVQRYVISSRPKTIDVGHADVLGPSVHNRLTLVTSDPPMAATRRLAVVADLKGNPEPALPGRPSAVRSDERGLQGMSGSVAPVIFVWLELLAAAVVGTWFVYRRWPRSQAWVVTTPVLAALLWVSFEGIVRLLPATL
jgi:sortase A